MTINPDNLTIQYVYEVSVMDKNYKSNDNDKNTNKLKKIF
jgi:hypothetical protein